MTKSTPLSLQVARFFLSQKSYFVCLNYSCFVIRRLNQFIWSQQLIKHELLTANEYSFGAFMHPRQSGRLPLYLRPGCGGGLSVGCCRARVKAGQIESFSTMECSITMQRSCTQSQQTISAIMVCFQWNSDDEEKLYLKKDQKWKLYPVSKNHINVFVTKF